MKAKMGFVVLGMMVSASSFAASNDCTIFVEGVDSNAEAKEFAEYAEHKAHQVGCIIVNDAKSAKYSIDFHYGIMCGYHGKQNKFIKYISDHSRYVMLHGTLLNSDAKELSEEVAEGASFSFNDSEESQAHAYKNKAQQKKKKLIRKLFKTIKKLEN